MVVLETAKEEMAETATTMITDALTYPAETEACPITTAERVPMKKPTEPDIRRDASLIIVIDKVMIRISTKEGKGTPSRPVAILKASAGGTIV